ncbi:Integral membrane protein OS=Streptomyces griseomycini OX=66895 GN=FHS37_005427 PE=4 SV=1 [Streptomyces griseomycini]
MTKLLLSLHVLAAIVAVGPVTVAASMSPPAVRRAAVQAGGGGPTTTAVTTVELLHRICRVYARIGIAVPFVGFATALAMGVLGDGWLVTSRSP